MKWMIVIGFITVFELMFYAGMSAEYESQLEGRHYACGQSKSAYCLHTEIEYQKMKGEEK